MNRMEIEITPALGPIQRGMLNLVPGLMPALVRELAQQALQQAQTAADRHTKTGALVRSLKLKPQADGGWLMGHDLQMAPHALFVHWGTRPHEIRARNKQALRFVWRDGLFHYWWGPKSPQEKAQILRWMRQKAPGSVAHFRWPHHPGYRGDPYLERTRLSMRTAFRTIAQRTWDNTTRRLFG
jgi:hypothetical protein